MKKIIAIIIALMLSTSILSVGVWAFFTDTETSASNALTAGTLDLAPTTDGTGPAGKYTVIAGGNGINGKVEFQKLTPGDSFSITWVLTNNGSLSGNLAANSNVIFSDNGQNEPEASVTGNNGSGNGDMDEYIGVRVQRGVGTDRASAEANFNYVLGAPDYYMPSSSLEAALNLEHQAMSESGGNNTIVYRISFNVANDLKGAGGDGRLGTADDVDVNENIIQSDTANIDITFTLTQSEG